MVDWNRFAPADFEYDFENDKLGVHKVTFEEERQSSVSFPILKSGAIGLTKTATSLSEIPSEDENSKLFFNLKRGGLSA
jgi:hypothetical protein